MEVVLRLLIIRDRFTERSSIGTLAINFVPFCQTLEPVARAVGVLIPDTTAIPAGDYNVCIDFSQRFQKKMPHIMDVRGREGIRIHKGNNPTDTTGCILLGFQRGQDMIWESEKAFNEFFAQLDAAITRGEKATLEIKNEQNA